MGNHNAEDNYCSPVQNLVLKEFCKWHSACAIVGRGPDIGTLGDGLTELRVCQKGVAL